MLAEQSPACDAKVRISFVQPDGERIDVQSEVGLTLMRAALNAGVSGIEADCGGAATCGTCHVYVAETWAARLTPPDEVEEATLEFAIDPRANSRLSCQVPLSAELNGIEVHLPVSQY